MRDLKDLAIPLLPIKEQQKIIDSIQQKEKEIQLLKEKIEANKQSINEEINQVWQSEKEKSQ